MLAQYCRSPVEDSIGSCPRISASTSGATSLRPGGRRHGRWRQRRRRDAVQQAVAALGASTHRWCCCSRTARWTPPAALVRPRPWSPGVRVAGMTGERRDRRRTARSSDGLLGHGVRPRRRRGRAAWRSAPPAIRARPAASAATEALREGGRPGRRTRCSCSSWTPRRATSPTWSPAPTRSRGPACRWSAARAGGARAGAARARPGRARLAWWRWRLCRRADRRGHRPRLQPLRGALDRDRAEGRVVLHLDGRPAEQVYLEKLGAAGERIADARVRAPGHGPPDRPARAARRRPAAPRARAAPTAGAWNAPPTSPRAPPSSSAEQTPEAIVRSTFDAVSDALAAAARPGAAPRWCSTAPAAAARSAARASRSTPRSARCVASFGGDAPQIAGLYTRGEVGRVRGAKGDRNHAVVVAAFG